MIVTPDIYGDVRGRFIETYRRSWFPLGREMVQGNRSDRQRGAVVGLHYHLHQADYWYVSRGRARVVLHDLRVGSPTDGATEILEIGEVTDLTLTYLVDSYYNPTDELGVAWDDLELRADWGVADPVVSARDRANPRRSEIPDHLRPRYGSRT